jgi:hypothetical protein
VSGIDFSRIEGITGFLTPLAQDRDELGRTINIFGSADDVKRIEASYACGNCCATFDRFRLECPLCRQPTHVTGQRLPTPPEIEAFYRDHAYGTDQLHGNRRTADEALHGISRDDEIEQIPLSKITPKHRPH